MPTFSLEGQTLGKYHILEPLGRGGMAQVYRAYHPQLDRYLAIKVLRSDLVEEEEFLARFRREARAVAGLRHPNIVQVFDFDVQDDLYYMVMELLDGDTLKARLSHFRQSGEHIPLAEVVRVLTDVLAGLEYAHSEGIIHRDIKPANILLNRRGQAVLTDFGIAQIVGGTQYTVSGALMGTLHYMAPEQGLHGQCDSRSDLYSLGIVFYEMLMGQPPFDADTPLAILMKHLNDPLPLPRQVEPNLPEAFERVVLKVLSKRPEDRFQQAQDFSQALQQAAAQSGLSPWKETVRLLLSPDERQSATIDNLAASEDSLAETPAGAVFSGSARQRIPDLRFTEDDTDPHLEERLEEAANRVRQTVGTAAADLEKTLPEFFHALGDAARPVIKPALESVKQSLSQLLESKTDRNAPQKSDQKLVKLSVKLSDSSGDHAQPKPDESQVQAPTVDQDIKQIVEKSEEQTSRPGKVEITARPQPWSVTRAALVFAGLLVGYNVLAIFFSSRTHQWSLFRFGWPVELLLVGLGLSLLMSSLRSIYFLIPVGLLVGNGFLLSYFSLSGNWGQWVFLWPLEVFLVASVIVSTLWLARREDRAAGFSQRSGILIASLAGWLAFIVAWLSLLAGLLHK